MEYMEKEKNKRRVGILTHYYDSDNYGGVLQAFALCKVINDLGYEAEQICMPVECVPFSNNGEKQKKQRSKFISRAWDKLMRIIFDVDEICANRKKAVTAFANTYVPHSAEVYRKDTIKKTIELYDIFVAGSDQVWNTDFYVPAFFLDFVPDEKPKFSYAASIAKDSLTDAESLYFKEKLRSYIGVSVREDNAVKQLQHLSPVNVEWVVDPVFLISQNEWDKIADKKNKIERKYVFCYFLGDNRVSREIARKYANKEGLAIITVQYLGKKYRREERSFGDVRIKSASPEEFVSLIKQAEIVVTDSFHAIAFSAILGKSFVATQRGYANEMISRLDNILLLLDEKDRFISNKKYSENKYDISKDCNAQKWQECIEKKRLESLNYLRECLKRSEAIADGFRQ